MWSSWAGPAIGARSRWRTSSPMDQTWAPVPSRTIRSLFAASGIPGAGFQVWPPSVVAKPFGSAPIQPRCSSTKPIPNSCIAASCVTGSSFQVSPPSVVLTTNRAATGVTCASGSCEASPV